MLVLLLHIGERVLCIRASYVTEVIPRVPAPSGLLHYRGRIIPIVDLKLLLTGEPSSDFLSTRIVVVEHGGACTGLVAERLTETAKLEESELVTPPATAAQEPYLGAVILRDGTMMRELLVERLAGREGQA
jgi:chemotaxis-related protein WspB